LAEIWQDATAILHKLKLAMNTLSANVWTTHSVSGHV